MDFNFNSFLSEKVFSSIGISDKYFIKNSMATKILNSGKTLKIYGSDFFYKFISTKSNLYSCNNNNILYTEILTFLQIKENSILELIIPANKFENGNILINDYELNEYFKENNDGFNTINKNYIKKNIGLLNLLSNLYLSKINFVPNYCIYNNHFINIISYFPAEIKNIIISILNLFNTKIPINNFPDELKNNPQLNIAMQNVSNTVENSINTLSNMLNNVEPFTLFFILKNNEFIKIIEDYILYQDTIKDYIESEIKTCKATQYWQNIIDYGNGLRNDLLNKLEIDRTFNKNNNNKDKN